MAGVNERYVRTETDVQKVIQLAKLEEGELNEVTQILEFAPNSDQTSNIKFLELDAHLLATLNEGERLTFRGDEDESAVLCSKNKTYDVKEAETSNSLLLIKDLKFGKETVIPGNTSRDLQKRDVRGVFYTYYEVRECKPKLSKLSVLLEPSAFKGTEYEKSLDPKTLYDWNRLLNEVQCSEDELKRALSDYVVIDFNGYLRQVSFEYEARALTMMLDLIEENSWELDEIDEEVTYSSLEELIPKSILEALFKSYTEPSGKTTVKGDPLYRYNEEKTCKFLARVLLAASPTNNYNEFMDAWRIGTPEKMEPKDAYLSGVALIVYNSGKKRKEVISFPETKLPDGINERFQELFSVREKWTLEEITPYVLSLTSSKMNVNALLTKYARSSIMNKVKYYSAKHSK